MHPDEHPLAATRRTFLRRGLGTLGGFALGSLLDPRLFADTPANDKWQGVVHPLHFPQKAKRVIFLYQAGGPSHLETFDYKPKLAEMSGQGMPASFTTGPRPSGAFKPAVSPEVPSWRVPLLMVMPPLKVLAPVSAMTPLPVFVTGLKQGWAFAWRSLMSGELVVIVTNTASIGVLLENAQNMSDMPSAIAIMIVILALGILIDGLFTLLDNVVRRRWGLNDASES